MGDRKPENQKFKVSLSYTVDPGQAGCDSVKKEREGEGWGGEENWTTETTILESKQILPTPAFEIDDHKVGVELTCHAPEGRHSR